MNSIACVELGGSSSQTCIRDDSGAYWFSPGVICEPEQPVALACPGIVSDGKVLWATNLGWPDTADPAKELGITNLRLVVNDAIAAALGESILQSDGRPRSEIIYISIGTGVGSAIVKEESASDLDLGHTFVGGSNFCSGCRGVGCLNSELSAQALPIFLREADQTFIAEKLHQALRDIRVSTLLPIVLGGGIARRYPMIASMLDALVPNGVELSHAPFEAKSAAYRGLDYLAHS
jgi:predicted NBD/HSP70 family sugar kinase